VGRAVDEISERMDASSHRSRTLGSTADSMTVDMGVERVLVEDDGG
jgi:hypothetical protein